MKGRHDRLMPRNKQFIGSNQESQRKSESGRHRIQTCDFYRVRVVIA
jgi:hypothetical protein